MLTMSHHNRPFDMYGYAVQTPPAPRQFSGNGTSSAFSASAHPDEDWTKISDLAERRRIQNRIAQRNYRKKIKAKLAQIDRESQERESQARGQNGSSSEASSSKSKSNSTPKNKSNVKKQQSRTTRRSSSPPTSQLQQQFTPPMQHDDYIFPSNHQQLRDGSHTPPMVMYSAPAYPPVPGEMLQPSYNTHMDGYRTQTGYSEEYYSQPSMTMPPMDHFNDALRRGGIGEDSLFLAPYSYGMPGIAASGGAHVSHHPSPYEHMPLTPQSHYDHSAYGSEGETFEYETTP